MGVSKWIKMKDKKDIQHAKGPGAPHLCVREPENSEEKRGYAERALQLPEEKLRLIFESVTDGITITDLNGNLIDANQRALQMHGYSFKAEISGKSAFELIDPHEHEIVSLNMQKTIEEGSIKNAEYTLLKANGTKFPGRLNISVLKDIDGHPLGFISTIREITRHERVRETLHERDRKLRLISEASSDIIMILDLDFRIQFISRTGPYSPAEELLGVPLYSLVDKDTEGKVKGFLEKAVETRNPVTYRTDHRPCDGSIIYFESVASPIISAGKVEGLVVISRDVTEQQQAEELYRTLFMNSPIGAFILQENKFLLVNPQFQEYTEYSETELLDMDALNLIHPEDRKKVKRKVGRMLLVKSAHPYEFRIITKSGKTRWLMDTVAPIHYKGKNALLGNSINITQRKQAEEALRQSEERYRQLIGTLQEGIWVIDKDANTTFANQYLADMLGYSREEMIGKHLFTFMDEKGKEIITQSLARRRQGIKEQYDFEFIKKDGTRIYTTLVTAPLTDDEGKYAGSVAGVINITERKRMEKEKKRVAEEWETTINATEDHIYNIDKDYRLIRVNKAYADYVNMKPEDIIGKTCYEVIHRTNEPCLDCYQREVLITKKPVMKEIYASSTGKYFQAITSPVLDENGEIVTFIHTSRDITELKKIEERLQQSQLLTSLGTMTAGIAHEVNNPLGSILLYSELLLKNDVTHQVKKDLKIIHGEAKRAAKIMTDLLAYRKGIKIQKRHLNLYRIIRKVLDMRQYGQNVQNISIYTNLAEYPLYVKGDSSQLTQVFMNLLLNAEEALRGRSYGTITVSAQVEQQWLNVSIADDGPGIPEDNLKQVFHPFFTTKKVGEGTGLGLSTCYSIITKHNGLIRAENNEMGGATFIVELPLAEAVSTRKPRRKQISQVRYS